MVTWWLLGGEWCFVMVKVLVVAMFKGRLGKGNVFWQWLMTRQIFCFLKSGWYISSNHKILLLEMDDRNGQSINPGFYANLVEGAA